MTHIAIVGASAGGLATAEALRRAGHAGPITLVGDEAHQPYDRPPLSKQYLAGEFDRERLALRRQAEIEALDIDLRLSSPAMGLDADQRCVTLADGHHVRYDGLVVTTGVRPRRLLGSDGVAGVHVLRTMDDAQALKEQLRPGRRLVIVGAGFIGSEVASTGRRLGADVTLLESGPAPLAQVVGQQAGRGLARLHHAHGVLVRTEAKAAEILSAYGRTTGVRLADSTVVPADDVLVAVGSVPNTEWLDGSGLDVSDGLLCDEYSSAAPGVYGAGDVARWHNPLFGIPMRVEHRTNASEQGMTVAHNLLNPDRRRPYQPVPYVWSDQYGVRIQVYGYLPGHDEARVIMDGGSERLLVAYRRSDRLTGVLAVGVPPRVLRAWRALIATGTEWTTALSDPPALE